MNKLDIGIKFESNEKQAGQEFVDHLNFLAYAPCAVKPTFKEGLDSALGAYKIESGNRLKSFVPMGCGSEGIYDDIWKSTDINDLPDVIASMGFGDFFRKKFVDRFVAKGCFTSVWKDCLNEPFEKAGFRDPDGYYTVYGVMPYLLLVDKQRLGNIPLPKQWCDLLEPRFRDNIIICGGNEDEVADVPLLYLYKEYGENGLTRLATNVKESYHAAEMARIAGTANPCGAAVYILPWFFASCCPRTETVSMVWPEDGACSSPLYLLVKESKVKEMAAIIDYVTGVKLGRQCALSCFPSLNPYVDNNLPEGANFKWLGWDYIKFHDPAELRDYAHSVFISEWRKSGKGGRV
ncbi:MAG: ABC transporter substrate-binding protein [Spirochaetota bacterium]